MIRVYPDRESGEDSMMRLVVKRKNKKGFSLTELLVAILILSMVSAVVAGGIPVAKDAYEKITVTANAQVMLSTAVSALRNELCTANVDAESTSGKKIRYYNPSINNYSEISSETGNIRLNQFADYNPSGSEPRTLVSVALGDGKLSVTYDSVSYDSNNGIITFQGLKVVDTSNSNKEYASLSDLEIRVIDKEKGVNTKLPVTVPEQDPLEDPLNPTE